MVNQDKMNNIIHITSEVSPFYKRGGLGDVLGALPKYLSTKQYANVVFSQYYENRMTSMDNCSQILLEMEIYGMAYAYHCYYTERDAVRYYFLNLSDRDIFADLEYDDGDSAYKGASSVMFYLYYAKAVLHTIKYMEISPQYVFCHDWQSAGFFAFKEEVAFLKAKNSFRSIYVIHNYEYQGDIFEDCIAYLPPDASEEIKSIFQKYRSASLLALGIEKSDFIATVSATYAKELETGYLPHKGLKYLNEHGDQVIPFLNGVDYDIWHPSNSPYLEVNYSSRSVVKKRKIKEQIFEYCQFEQEDNSDTPLLLMMARLTPQKGIQLVANYSCKESKAVDNMTELLNIGIRIIIYGAPSGGLNGVIHERLLYLHTKFKGKLYYNPKYEEVLAHKFLAASDMLLAPSLFEPCGLVQIYAMAFGTLPIVRPVGGLKDTVICHNRSPEKSTGFYIDDFSTESLIKTLQEVVQLYQNRKDVWRKIQQRAMKQDYSWNKMVKQYFDFFRKH